MKSSSENAKLDGDTANVGAPTVEDQINAIGIGNFHHIQAVMLGLLCMADGMEMIVLSLLSTPLSQEWNASKIEIGFLASAIFLGTLIGGLAGGAAGDIYGRRATILFGGCIFITAAAASACAPDLIALCLLRCLVGFGYGILLPVAMCSIAELIPTASRANYNLFLCGVAWAFGEILVCVTAIVVHRYDSSPGWWRVVLFTCAIPGAVGVVLAAVYMPESPHFLCAQGRHAELEALVRDIAARNGRTDALLQGGRVRQLRESPDPEWSWFHLFSRDLLPLTAAVSAVWSVCSFAYYGMTFVYPLVLEERYHMEFEHQLVAVMLAAAAEIPGIMIAMYLVGHELVGRRLALAAFFGASAAVAALVPFFNEATSFLIINMVLKTAINGAFGVLLVYAVEIFPTSHRSSGVSLCGSVARVASISSPIALAVALTLSVTLTYEIVGLSLGIGLLVTALIPYDTSKKPLATFAYEAIEHATGNPETRPLNRPNP